MIANDDLAYKTRHVVGAHILLTLQNKFTFPFIVSKYVTRYTFRKLHDCPIRIYVNERAGYMQRMRNRRYNTCCLGCLSFLFTNPPFCFLTPFYVSSLWARLFQVSVSIFRQIE